MKIVFTVNTYYPLKDGVQFVTEYHAERLAKRGHTVTVVTPKYHGQKEVEDHNGVHIIRVNIRTKHAIFIGDKRAYKDLILKLTHNADALVNVCTQTATTEVLYSILKHVNCKKILYMHGMFDFEWHTYDFKSAVSFGHKLWNTVRWKYDYIVNRKYMKAYDDIIQLHQYDTANVFFKKKYHIKSYIIENAADDRFFLENNTSDNKVPYLLCVSNYDTRKNQEFILRAFYKSHISGTDLILIGSSDNNYKKFLEKLKSQLDLQYGEHNVYIKTGVSRERTIQYIKNAKIFLMGSKWEAFPISIVESISSGVPYISTNVGIVRYLPGGIIVDSVEQMSYWIQLFCNDEKLRVSVGKVGKVYAENRLTIEEKVNLLEKIITSD
ncbi:glycosyltransferase family 4 protein [Limosilactobacillus reuteri]|uniref:Putative glycosyltransferase n=1 Tax=Limosilactobacillus reuteri subsp. suis (strain ATCC 53608 / LMG 31752 / 1063) TaxID=927703 RepID=F8KGN7_LIMR5|nr:putative glycosyltransferase [Limosilactobacillus reuteri subsp. suis]CUU12453.1 glycosyltransferase family 4 protein [Limosilactobacillus reuteri subsp. suis]